MSETVETPMFLPGASGNTQFWWGPIAEGLSHQRVRRFFGWPGTYGSSELASGDAGEK
jgi:hypothetical protein